MQTTISERSIVVIAKDQISCDLAGEEVVLNLLSGIYYGMDEVATQIWNMIQEPRAVNDIKNAILQEYEVAPDRCERDIMALLRELAVEGLIEIKDETSS